MNGTVRIGKVTSVDPNSRKARVFFPDVEILSGWLSVLSAIPNVVALNTNGHTHIIAASAWLPKIDDIVLCVYSEGFNADGYILGGLSE